MSFCCVHYINFNNDSYEDQYVEDTYQEDYAEYVEEEALGEDNADNVALDDSGRLHGGGEDYRINTKIFDMNQLKENRTDMGAAISIENRTTTRFMTKYERARLLGTRALQLR